MSDGATKSSVRLVGGIGFPGALTLVFIVLKLLGTITWSWWWVLSPLWISAVSGLAGALVGALIVLALAYTDIRDRPARRREPGRPLPHEHGPRYLWGRKEQP